GVAFWAHIGGAVAGMVLVPFFKRRDVPLLAGVGGRPLPAAAADSPKIRLRRPGTPPARRPWRSACPINHGIPRRRPRPGR
ncbi:MAG: hypothetical protein RLO49_05530, partial [Rhodospirillales bacterium]